MTDNVTITDLEGAVLGLVARDGPVTAYAVMRSFMRSPSRFWSGSSGAIYPLLKRIKVRGFIAGQSAQKGNRNATAFVLTTQGRDALNAWLLDADRAADIGFDPLRTRLYFLNLVSTADRNRLLDAVAEKTLAAGDDERWQDDPPPDQHIGQTWLANRLMWLKTLRENQ